MTLGYRMIIHFCMSFLGGCLAVSILFLALPHTFLKSPEWATVDVTGLIHDFVKTESTVVASPAQHQASVRLFSQELDGVLQRISEEKGVILVPKEAVIAGMVPDVTSEVKKDLMQVQLTQATSSGESEK